MIVLFIYRKKFAFFLFVEFTFTGLPKFAPMNYLFLSILCLGIGIIIYSVCDLVFLFLFLCI